MAAEKAPWRVSMLVVVFAVSSIFLFISLPIKFDQHFRVETTHSFRAPKINVFSELTSQEADDVYDFVLDELAYLNLVGTLGVDASKKARNKSSSELKSSSSVDTNLYSFRPRHREATLIRTYTLSRLLDRTKRMLYRTYTRMPAHLSGGPRSPSLRPLPMGYLIWSSMPLDHCRSPRQLDWNR